MRTMVIFTEIPDEKPKIAILDGDLRRLNNIYINEAVEEGSDEEKKQQEVLSIFYKDGARNDELFTDLPAIIGEYASTIFLIHCGFLL